MAPIIPYSATHLHQADAFASVLPLRLNGLTSEGVFDPDISSLSAAVRAAADAGDYRRAAALQDVLAVAQPRPLLSVDDCAPPEPDDAAAFFVENGFVVVKQLFDAPLLARMQQAWRRAAAPARALWDQARAMGEGEQGGLNFSNQAEIIEQLGLGGLPFGRRYFDIPVKPGAAFGPEGLFFAEALDGDPALLELLAPPKLMAVLRRIVGEDVALVGVQPRTVPPEDEGGYTSWVRESNAAHQPAADSCALRSTATRMLGRAGRRRVSATASPSAR